MKIKLLDCFTKKQPFLNFFNWGKNDLELMEKLINAGTEHRKFLRMCENVMHTESAESIIASTEEKKGIALFKDILGNYAFTFFIPRDIMRGVRASRQSYNKIDTYFRKKVQIENNGKSYYFFEIDAPLYLWKQLDTYKQDTTTLSESTMYNIMKKDIKQADFEDDIPEFLLATLNSYRNAKKFEELINILPCGYIQKRFFFCNKEVLERVIKQRQGHKLEQWAVIVNEFKRVVEEE